MRFLPVLHMPFGHTAQVLPDVSPFALDPEDPTPDSTGMLPTRSKDRVPVKEHPAGSDRPAPGQQGGTG